MIFLETSISVSGIALVCFIVSLTVTLLAKPRSPFRLSSKKVKVGYFHFAQVTHGVQHCCASTDHIIRDNNGRMYERRPETYISSAPSDSLASGSI